MDKETAIAFIRALVHDEPMRGVCDSDEETCCDWAETWFGDGAKLNGVYRKHSSYLYSYDNPVEYLSKEFLTGVVSLPDNAKVYLYLLD